MVMQRLLITGASGTLGRQVALLATQQGRDVCGTYFTNPPPLAGQWLRLDVRDRQAVMDLMRQIRPTAVAHTAFRPSGEELWATTAEGAAVVARASQEMGARLIHVSSDAIFDGTCNPYTEAAHPNPRTLYGAAKAAAELAVSAIAPQAAIVRTSLTMSREPLDPHTRFILDLAAGRITGCLFSDQYRCPIGVDDLAGAILELAAGDFAGILHVAGADVVSRSELGCAVARVYHLPEHEVARLTAGPIPPQMASTTIPDIRLDATLAHSLLKTRLRGIYEWFGGDSET
jgi:dTDP-4-dehydrorhamnose reductase